MHNKQRRHQRRWPKHEPRDKISSKKLSILIGEGSVEDRKRTAEALQNAVNSLKLRLVGHPIQLKIATFMLEDALKKVHTSDLSTVMASADGGTRRKFSLFSDGYDDVIGKGIGAAYSELRTQLGKLTS